MVKRAPFMWGACAVSASAMLQERKDVLGDDFEHRSGVFILQSGPAHLLISYASTLADFIFPRGKYTSLDRLAEPVRLVLLAGVRLVERADEEEIGERIGDATRPESVPHVVDL